MDCVRTGFGLPARDFNRELRQFWRTCRRERHGNFPVMESSPVLDIVYILGVIALFALVGLVAKAVEKL